MVVIAEAHKVEFGGVPKDLVKDLRSPCTVGASMITQNEVPYSKQSCSML